MKLLIIGLVICSRFMTCQSYTTTDTSHSLSQNLTADKPFVSKALVRHIKGGKYLPLYGDSKRKVEVRSFAIDASLVTQADFQDFVLLNKRWRRSQIAGLFADTSYLHTWTSDTTFSGNPRAPITNISWFAAKAYCQCQGKRLPTVDEWEYVAMANTTMPDARQLPSFNKEILSSYESPKTYLNSIETKKPNFWGVYDLHGVVWEWTSDFNSVLLTGESRNDTETDKNLFCGSGSLNATDLMNYAAFMRYAFRGSLKAKYSVQTLGFRCAKNIP